MHEQYKSQIKKDKYRYSWSCWYSENPGYIMSTNSKLYFVLLIWLCSCTHLCDTLVKLPHRILLWCIDNNMLLIMMLYAADTSYDDVVLPTGEPR